MSTTGQSSIIGHPPKVTITERTHEQAKYETLWTKPEYRKVAPGEGAAQHFLQIAKPPRGSTVIDFGCGTGRGALMLAVLGDVRVEMTDFASNCLDDDIWPMLQTQSHALRFTQHDLTKPLPDTLRAAYGFCTDMMEHIPTDDVPKVLEHILEAAQHVYFQISTVDDSCGVLVGETLHHTVRPGKWWLDQLHALGAVVHFYTEQSHCVTIYCTRWMSGEQVTKEGKLNVELDVIRRNVAANIVGDWQQVKPFEPNDKTVMILGGGPSLDSQLDMIRGMRQQGALLVTLNGAYNWALEKGLDVSGTVVCDAREFNARFVQPVQPKTFYFISSQCDPKTLEGLPKDRTWMWHTSAEDIADILNEKLEWWFGIPGGCTVLLRAIPLLRMLGYRQFHLFGCDSCVVDDKHHAYAQPENDGQLVVPVTCGPRVYKCNPWQVAQAQGFIDLIKFMGDEFELQVYGDGLLAGIIQHGYELDVADEESASS